MLDPIAKHFMDVHLDSWVHWWLDFWIEEQEHTRWALCLCSLQCSACVDDNYIRRSMATPHGIRVSKHTLVASPFAHKSYAADCHWRWGHSGSCCSAWSIAEMVDQPHCQHLGERFLHAMTARMRFRVHTVPLPRELANEEEKKKDDISEHYLSIIKESLHPLCW